MKLMNQRLLYQCEKEISRRFTSFTIWQRKRLARFSLGLLLAKHCHQSRIAMVLAKTAKAKTAKAKSAKAKSVIRQLHRCLSDKKWTVAQFSRDWTRWVAGILPPGRLVLMVDETTIGKRFRAMMVGVAFEGRCIQLAWTCYQCQDYPDEGQVSMIASLLEQIKSVLPADRPVLLLADRGIGTSPDLCKAVAALGWNYLFRVQKTVKIKTDGGTLQPYMEVKKGGRWSASGSVFIKRGKIPAHIRAIWQQDCAEPWILVTNNPALTGQEYAQRNWQEQSFRDLKSGGWQLANCRLRSVERMTRFLAILVLAQGMALALGSLAVEANKTRKLIKTKEGRLRRALSLFKEGLNYFTEHVMPQNKFPPLRFIPDKRLC